MDHQCKCDKFLLVYRSLIIPKGMFSDYFVVGCKTKKGFSVLLVERSDAVETKLIKTSYSTTAGTAFVEFNDAKVPVDHLLGEEHKGFVVISTFDPHDTLQYLS